LLRLANRNRADTGAILEAAWEYVAAHAGEIDRAIWDNGGGEEGFVERRRMVHYADEDFAFLAVEDLRLSPACWCVRI